MIRFTNILRYLLILLCTLNTVTAIITHFSSADVTTPFPIRAFSAVIVGVAAYLLLSKKLRTFALFGLVAYLLLICYYIYHRPLPAFGITITGALESLVCDATSSFLLSSVLSYLGTILVVTVIVSNLFFNKPVPKTVPE
jgi:hypothetical protein